jgi:Tol biopolymer transport system component
MLATAEPLPSPINFPNAMQGAPCLSVDGRTLYFTSDRPGGYGKWDLWVAERSSPDAEWGDPVNLGPEVNTAAAEVMPTISADGLTLFFGDGNPFSWRARNGTANDYQIWMTTRATPQSPWGPPVALGPPVGSEYIDDYPHLTNDGLSLYFTSARPESFGLNVAQRTSPSGPWLTVTNLGSAINQPGTWNAFPWLSSDGLRLIYQSDRSGGRGGYDLWMSTRSSVSAGWPTPVNLGGQVNSGFYEVSPCVSADFPAIGSYLLFARNDINGWNNRFKIYRSMVIPNVSLLRAATLDGPWTPVNASFVPVSGDTILAEGALDARWALSFYHVKMSGETGSVHLLSAERSGAKFRVRFQWAR